MKKLVLFVAALALVGLGYLAGRRGGAAPSGASESPSPKADRKIAFYRNPMDPSIHSDHPAQDSMGMDYVPVYEDELNAPASTVEGRASVVIPADRRQLLGVRSEPLARASLSRAIRTVGRVVPDERLVHHVHTKYDGFIEHVYVDFIGKYVKKGEPLLSIYKVSRVVGSSP